MGAYFGRHWSCFDVVDRENRWHHSRPLRVALNGRESVPILKKTGEKRSVYVLNSERSGNGQGTIVVESDRSGQVQM